MSGNTGQHITMKTVVGLPVFLRFRGDHTGNFFCIQNPACVTLASGADVILAYFSFMKRS